MEFSIYRSHDLNICATCGTRYRDARKAGDHCPICDDDRQYLGDNGQEWTSYATIANTRTLRFAQLQPNLFDLRITPAFAIGLKAHLVLSPGGNILWDCLPFIDEPSMRFIQSKGGLKAIVISHPHYYSLMVEWARLFDCPVYLHAADAEWVMEKTEHIRLWEGTEKLLWDGIRIIHVAAHFPGSTVLHLPDHEQGTLLTGDSLYVSRDRKQLSCMYSYPNMIPVSKKELMYVMDQVAPLSFDAIYGAFEWMHLEQDAKAIFNRSMQRYLQIFE